MILEIQRKNNSNSFTFKAFIMENSILFFEMDELYKGLANASGIIKIHNDKLLIQFNIQDSIFGVIKSKPKTIELYLKNIVEIKEIKKYFCKIPHKLKIRVDDLELFKSIPGLENICEIELKIKKNENIIIQSFLSKTSNLIADYKLAQAMRG